MRKYVLTAIISTLALAAVYGTPGVEARELRLPEVPSDLREPVARLRYVLENYWQHMPWDDAEAMADSMFIEQVSVDFFDLLTHADSAMVADAYDRLIDAQSPSAGEYINRLAIKYLYSPDSPVFSTRTYEAVARTMLARGQVDDVRRLVLESDLADLAKNRPGAKATDFEFVDREDNRLRLSEVVGNADRTILFFYDPDCSTCQEVETKMAADGRLAAQIATKQVQVVAIDPYGEDIDRWREHAATLPSSWTVGYSPDGEVDSEELYLLLTSPTVYMLDKEGRVINRP